ncbi:hypothetical protein PTSG_10332 [Salpingoeca rosetta]|uniref:Phosphatidylethanolamine N-methyltransferase n=1 Tax=Salpingoeca rosetta (strain ATCC 50818 / BSB-021) TaxID=946362 RepID=F2UR01_SALR5|nr:uncharacterized protein PTSG_10332 [Salpingoeca rosetta]EGD80056.1 hypothetical protein PTSG_10332 [Salpingoeca rosetta]|eukprot:XP_004988381.1 hypothetical protein PTSG_10332 [Salpingoeca rosetta]
MCQWVHFVVCMCEDEAAAVAARLASLLSFPPHPFFNKRTTTMDLNLNNVLDKTVNKENTPIAIAAAGGLIMQVLVWNIVARNEYHNKTLTRFFGSAERAIRFNAFLVIFGGFLRDRLVEYAMTQHPTMEELGTFEANVAAFIIWAVGMVLVGGSFYHLGWRNTYMGDYFGFLLPARVTSFPFNVCDHPMFLGSSLLYLAKAIYFFQSPIGIVLAAFSYVVYIVFGYYEDAYTAMIYAKKAEEDKKKGK